MWNRVTFLTLPRSTGACLFHCYIQRERWRVMLFRSSATRGLYICHQTQPITFNYLRYNPYRDSLSILRILRNYYYNQMMSNELFNLIQLNSASQLMNFKENMFCVDTYNGYLYTSYYVKYL